MESLQFSLQAVAPLFILILIGIILRKKGWIDSLFVERGSWLVFHLSLPALLILKISSMDRSLLLSLEEVLLVMGLTLLVFVLSWVGGILFLKPHDRGAFCQGAFRGNMAIIGLALILQTAGDPGLQKGAVFVSILMPTFNVLATLVLVLSNPQGRESESVGKAVLQSLVKLIKNPLILAVLLGFLLFGFSIEIPSVLHQSLDYLGKLSLPLALICIGAGMDFSHMRENLGATLLSALVKVLILPVLALVLSFPLGLSPLSRLVVFILMGSPTAVSSFPMTRALGGNHGMAANVVALSTLMSILTLGIGLVIFDSMGWLL